jgi:hypothetical protein
LTRNTAFHSSSENRGVSKSTVMATKIGLKALKRCYTALS